MASQGLGVLANATATANDVVERNAYQGAVQVDGTNLQAAQLMMAEPLARVRAVDRADIRFGFAYPARPGGVCDGNQEDRRA